MKNPKFTVEIGEERWDYDSDIPIKEIIDYWVMFGKEVVEKFAYRTDAEDLAKKLNKVLTQITK